jgi:hypothetical protein
LIRCPGRLQKYTPGPVPGGETNSR